jgi:hypothetical protein
MFIVSFGLLHSTFWPSRSKCPCPEAKENYEGMRCRLESSSSGGGRKHRFGVPGGANIAAARSLSLLRGVGGPDGILSFGGAEGASNGPHDGDGELVESLKEPFLVRPHSFNAVRCCGHCDRPCHLAGQHTCFETLTYVCWHRVCWHRARNNSKRRISVLKPPEQGGIFRIRPVNFFRFLATSKIPGYE